MLNKKSGKPEYHVTVSLSLFFASLWCAGFYTGSDNPVSGIFILATGWFGLLDGHVSWYANPLYLYALIRRHANPIQALRVEVLALVLALLFLSYHSIVMDFFVGSSHTIVSYGLGYWLWVLSLATLFVDDLQAFKEKKLIFGDVVGKRIALITVCASVLISSFQISTAVYDQILIWYQRNQAWQKKCKMAGEQIYSKPRKVDGLYFWSSPGSYCYGYIDCFPAQRMIRQGLLQFYERDSLKKTSAGNSVKPYRRFTKGDTAGEETNTLKSQYTVMITPSREFDIHGVDVKIVERNSRHVIAKTAYFVTDNGGASCGHPEPETFYVEGFITRVFSLSPSKPTGSR